MVGGGEGGLFIEIDYLWMGGCFVDTWFLNLVFLLLLI